MASRWFRFYSEALNDPKILRLTDRQYRVWSQLLCIACENNGQIVIADLPILLRMKDDTIAKIILSLITQGLFERIDGVLAPHNWQARQFASDNRDTDGRRKWDETRRKVDGVWTNVAAHAPPLRREPAAADTETEQIRNRADTEEDAPAHPFALSYAQKYAQRTAGRRPPVTEHAAAIAIEREYGSDACIELATDLDWQKHPNYMRPILQERRDGKPERVERNGSYGPAPRPVEDAWPPAYGNRPKFILDPYGAGDGAESEHPAGDEGGLEVRVGAVGEGRDSDAAVRGAAAL